MSIALNVSFLFFMGISLKYVRPFVISLLDSHVKNIRNKILESRKLLQNSNARLNELATLRRKKIDNYKTEIEKRKNHEISNLIKNHEKQMHDKKCEIKKITEYLIDLKKDELKDEHRSAIINTIYKSIMQITKDKNINHEEIIAFYIQTIDRQSQ